VLADGERLAELAAEPAQERHGGGIDRHGEEFPGSGL
jgi:hypothetical protein